MSIELAAEYIRRICHHDAKTYFLGPVSVLVGFHHRCCCTFLPLWLGSHYGGIKS